jgi:cytochrome c oxidase cbb3-type subunit I/II
VNSLSHYTDWTIAHVHVGAMGWNGFLTFSMLYYLFPRLYRTQLWSTKLANWHFWIGLLGMMFYVIPVYVAGVTEGLMWKQFNHDGFLQYPNFLETIVQVVPMFRLRAIGGTLYLVGTFMMAYNLYRTAKAGQFEPDTEAQAAPLEKTILAPGKPGWHRLLEGKPLFFTVLATVSILVGGLVEIVPMFLVQQNVPTIASVHPYTPLEVLGRDIYIREGCLGCHSQMIRPFRSETERYGEYSKAGEYVYDHPFLWGSERKGPDLARVGGKYPNAWHFNHMDDPRATSPGSIMPRYSWLLMQKMETDTLPSRLNALRKLGVPYPAGYENGPAQKDLQTQADDVVAKLKLGSVKADSDREIIALIAYLQRLGTDIKNAPAVTAAK